MPFTFWLSVSPGSFVKKENSKFPKWIQVSLDMVPKDYMEDLKTLGMKKGVQVTADVERVRQFYLSADIDWTKILLKTKELKCYLKF